MPSKLRNIVAPGLRGIWHRLWSCSERVESRSRREHAPKLYCGALQEDEVVGTPFGCREAALTVSTGYLIVSTLIYMNLLTLSARDLSSSVRPPEPAGAGVAFMLSIRVMRLGSGKRGGVF
jgi:hypothetical protein